VILALIAMGRLGSAEPPEDPVTRDTYLRCIEETRPAQIARDPNLGAKAAYADELQATAHTSGIHMIRDDAEASVLRLELESGRTEWVVFNSQTETIRAAKASRQASHWPELTREDHENLYTTPIDFGDDAHLHMFGGNPLLPQRLWCSDVGGRALRRGRARRPASAVAGDALSAEDRFQPWREGGVVPAQYI